MIELYSGTPGSGKSLHCAYEIISALKMGKNVIANFPIDLGYFKKPPRGKFYYIPNSKISIKILKCFSKSRHKAFKENQTLFVLDECGILFNPRSWKDSDRTKWLEFFSQHRKLGYNILLISQADIMIDKQIRAQIEIEHKHRSVRNYKTFGFLISLIVGGLFMNVQYWYPCRLKIGTSFFLYNGKKAKIYDTFRIFE